MKKFLLFVMAILPMSMYAQAYHDSSPGFLSMIVMLAIVVGLFILCREIVCWYWKINQSVKNQEEIISLLKQIKNSLNDGKGLIVGSFSYFLGDSVVIYKTGAHTTITSINGNRIGCALKNTESEDGMFSPEELIKS